MAGSTWLLVLLFDFGWYWPVPDSSCRSWPEMWTVFLSSH